MHRFGFKLMHGGQKMGIMTVFWLTTNFSLGFDDNKYLKV